jgi:hypothetical protein
MDWNTLPKFLLCTEGHGEDEGRMFVMHAHEPRFLMEFSDCGEEGECRLLDPPTPDLPKLKHQAHEFFCGEQ